MNEEKIKELISQTKEIYNNSLPESYNNFIKWAKSFNGNDEGKIIKLIYIFCKKFLYYILYLFNLLIYLLFYWCAGNIK